MKQYNMKIKKQILIQMFINPVTADAKIFTAKK